MWSLEKLELKDLLPEEEEGWHERSRIWRGSGWKGSALLARAPSACSRFSKFEAENASWN